MVTEEMQVTEVVSLGPAIVNKSVTVKAGRGKICPHKIKFCQLLTSMSFHDWLPTFFKIYFVSVEERNSYRFGTT